MATARTRQLRLRRLMRAHNLTAAGVAALVGRSASVVRGWRTGHHNVPVQMLRLLELELEYRARAAIETVATAQP
jgi:transcriptional regulator with XRE-family HTH domain